MASDNSKTFYSVGSVIVVALILIVANFILGTFRQRADLTQGSLYTLADGTRRILSKVDQPIRIRYYFSQGDAGVPLPLKSFGRRVEDLLAEYKSAGRGRVVVEKLDPQPDSEAEDSAGLDGVSAQTLPTGERFFLGLALSYADKRVAIPNLTLDREQLLEYDISRAISQVITKTKPVVGVMTTTNMFGFAGNVMGTGGPPTPKQVYISELERDFDVKRVSSDADRIDDAIKVLVVIHPRDIPEKTQFAIDQFVMRGGKLVAMVDPFAYFDAASRVDSRQPQPVGSETGTVSTLDKLFRAWGVEFDTARVVQDTTYALGEGASAAPAVLALVGNALSKDDVTISNVGSAVIPFAGVFIGKPADGLTSTVLLKTSKRSRLINRDKAAARGATALQDFQPSDIEYALAIRLTGKFKTAYPKGKPEEPAKGGRPAAESAAPAGATLKESPETGVVLIGDVDFVNDAASVQIQEVLGQRIVVPANGNLVFAQAVVEQFAGDQDLISLRSRAVAVRPFTVVRDMQARAQQNYLGKIQALEATLQTTSQALQALQPPRIPGQESTATNILTPQQQAEIDKFRTVSAQTRRELKQVRQELRRDSDALEFWTKVINIGAMPLLVTIAGIALAVFRRRRVVKL